MKKILIATTNLGKLREIRGMLAGLPIDLVSLSDVPPLIEPDEIGTTFAENARLKALYYNAHLEWFHQYLGGGKAPWDSGALIRNAVFEKD